MTNIFKSPLSLLLGFMVLMGVLTACQDDEVTASSEVELLSFGPTGAKPGDNIRFIGNNLDQVTEVILTGATVSKAAFVEQSPELIVITIPQEAGEGLVTLKATTGEVVSKTILSFEVVVTVQEWPVEAKPGQDITIKGDYLQWVNGVTFANDTTVIEFVSQSYNQLVVTVPMTAQSGPMILHVGGTEATKIEGETELKVTLPELQTMTPNPAEKGKALLLKGNNMDLVQGIKFKGVADAVVDFSKKTATEIEVVIPAKASKGAVSLIAYSGVAVESEEVLRFVDDLPELAPLAYSIYEDKLMNSWQDWGWGTTKDLASKDQVRMGEAAAKFTFKGEWGAAKFANGNLKLDAYSEVTFSIFGGTGTDGKSLNVGANDGKNVPIVVKEGAWTTYTLTMAQLGSPTVLKSLLMQETGWSGTVYVDHVGLR